MVFERVGAVVGDVVGVAASALVRALYAADELLSLLLQCVVLLPLSLLLLVLMCGIFFLLEGPAPALPMPMLLPSCCCRRSH